MNEKIDNELNQNKISVNLKTDEVVIPKDKIVTVYYTPRFLQITDIKNQSDIPYKKINNQVFLNVETGELKQGIKNSENARSISSLRKTFSRISLLIKSNFNGDKSECFISLSYNRKVSDNKELNRDIKNLYAKLTRNTDVPYRCLVVLEYQGNGNVHIHILVKRLDNECLYINELEKNSLWENGTCDIQRLYDSDGLADYLNPFKISHKRKRLKYYKQNMQIYRCYGHFDRPQKDRITLEEALNLVKVNNLKTHNSISYDIVNDKNVVNTITKFIYKGDKKL